LQSFVVIVRQRSKLLVWASLVVKIWQLAPGENAMTVDGLVTIPSGFGPKETMDRLERDQSEGVDRVRTR
jgi:hypothetical protein